MTLLCVLIQSSPRANSSRVDLGAVREPLGWKKANSSLDKAKMEAPS
ncbi:MAG: hypothetical protein BTN85_0503 [Candidatus Methanohalarchaeum thermophilum]|uniref:Uncharacterized protein n=1 Tax=Methanohalarchaeum thermophilum TaxID=1903181 RepID=A0A1Q6DUK1_METT1|nr:MAG: hypothetical protein BTN85_0503 [Candidatus Methanohalarchaeum thermophilum]